MLFGYLTEMKVKGKTKQKKAHLERETRSEFITAP